MHIWAHCFQSFASQADPHFPVEFQMAANAILVRDFGMGITDITLNNARVVFLHLVNEMNA